MSRKSKRVSRRTKNGEMKSRDGQIVKRIPIPPELATELREQIGRFRAKFGRDPGPEDPLFFDPDADEPRPIDENAAFDEIAAIAAGVGVPPQLIYAMKKTGRIVTEENKKFLAPAELQEWKDAIAEYHEKVKQSGVM